MKFVQLNNQKKPKTKLESKYYKDTFEQWNNAGLIIGTEIIVLDFDGDNKNEEKIIKFIESNYPTLCVTTSRGKHYYYAMPKDYNFKRKIDAISIMGFQCDYLTGEKAIATIKLNGSTREMNMELQTDNLPQLPECFYPLEKSKNNNLTGMLNGDGRNNSIFNHLIWVRKTYPDIDIKKIASIINNNIFGDKLENKELNSIIDSVSKQDIKTSKNTSKIDEIECFSAKELQNKDLPPIIFYVEDLIPQGLNIICSAPKIGKSFLAIDMCLSIARGLPFLGFNTKKAGCLYLALEDSQNRLKSRLKKLLPSESAPENFICCTNVKNATIEDGLISFLESFIKKRPDIKVIIIDTLQKVRSDYKGNDGMYAKDYKEMSKIKHLADAHDLCIVLIHHTRKGIATGDVFERVSGTNGIMGTADSTYILYKNTRTDEQTYLSVTGRDIDFNEYVLKFDKNNCKWSLISTIEEQNKQIETIEYLGSNLIKIIKNLVNKNKGKWTGTCKELLTIKKEEFDDGTTEKAIRSEIARFAQLLKSIDNIDYIPPKHPNKEGRIQTFIKNTVDTVVS